MMSRAGEHAYDARLTWTGNRGGGTATYEGYDRDYRISISGKADLVGSAHAQFRGDPAVHDPEDLLLGAITGCHMLAYLALCARNGVSVLAYEDEARGTLRLDRDGGG
ncbi:MAG: OsmC family protein, partial [Longimicrobiales bacterium]